MNLLNKISIVILILLFVTGLSLAIGMCGRRNVKQVQQVVRQSLFDSTTYYRDQYNVEHAVRQSEIAERNTIYALHAREIDSLCREIGIRKKQLQGFIKANMQAAGHIETVTIPVHDTLHDGNGNCLYQFTYADEYLQLTGQADSQKTTIDYTISVPLTISSYWKRRWFLGRKKYYVDGKCDNPNVHISGIKDIKIN